ncbi:MAG: HAD-IB family hydrolase [Bacillota bacterium]|nr:HAD-IB family hydrolase [Bacillota bacterium]
MKLAIFDFDGTLFPFDTFSFVVSQLKKHPQYKSRYHKFMIGFLPTYILYKLKVLARNKMVNTATKQLIAALDGMTRDELYYFYEKVYSVMKSRINKQVANEVADSKAMGFHPIIVSGAVCPLLEYVGKELAIDTIIGTEIPIKNGRVNANTEIDHIFGPRKLTKLLEIYPQEKVDWGSSCAYADSFSDLDILELVGSPVAVQPDERLAEIANNKGWKIIS